MVRVEFKIIEKVKLNNPILLEGFPGVGMIGTISASYIVDELKMKLIGYVSSTHFPPIVSIHNFKPVSPVRIYASEKYDLIVLFSEFIIPPEVIYQLSEKILEFAKKMKVSKIISLAGIASNEIKNAFEAYAIASTQKEAEFISKFEGINVIREGATQGVSGVLIANCSAEEFPALILMTKTNLPLDPRSSAKLLELLGTILNAKINTEKLIEEAHIVEEKTKEAMKRMKDLEKGYDSLNENPMYA